MRRVVTMSILAGLIAASVFTMSSPANAQVEPWDPDGCTSVFLDATGQALGGAINDLGYTVVIGPGGGEITIHPFQPIVAVLWALWEVDRAGEYVACVV